MTRMNVKRKHVAVTVPEGERETAASGEQGGEGTGHETREQDGHADGNGELVQKPSDNAGHEENRQEYRDQRQGHGQDRESDLL